MTTQEIKQIGTHSGSFHCDEALACWMLRVLHPKAEVVRTRDPKVLDSLPIIVDVGSVYDPSKGRFDHHQRGFTEVFDSEHKTKLSSAGLVYKHFGKEVIAALTGASKDNVELMWRKVYDNFIEALDGIDNGIPAYPAGVTPAYRSNTDLSSRVGKLNPSWNEKGIDIQARFHEAMAMTGKEFSESVMYLHKSWLPARDLVKDAMLRRKDVHASGQIVLLREYTVWKSHLLDLETDSATELKIDAPIIYVVYPDESKQWRVQAVPEREESFASRKALPEAWRGIRDEELSKISGIPGCVFVHASGFIGGAQTLEGALAMAVKALEMPVAAKKVDGEPEPKRQKIEA